MWGYQSQFQLLAQNSAESIFALLDGNLSPKVFLVGIQSDRRGDEQPVSLEPSDCGYDPDRFANIHELAQHLEAVDEERQVAHIHAGAEENHARQSRHKALMNAVARALRMDSEHRGIVSFCSWPVSINGYEIVVVLQLNRKAFDSHYALVRHTRDRMTIVTSLLDATVREYLDSCKEALSQSNPGTGSSVVERANTEVIRAAGKSLMAIVAYAGKPSDATNGLFDACNTISSLKYEGAESFGRMLIARKGHPNIDVAMTLERPVPMQDYRAVRKLLEITSESFCLLSDASNVFGLGRTVGLYDYRAEDLYSIRYTKHYTWELVHADHLMMRVVYGQPELPRMRIDRRAFTSDIKRIFPLTTPKEIAQLWELVVEAMRQKHGTMVVVSNGAREEVLRLANQATVVEPAPLTAQVMRLVTAIDGAVLIDPSSTCYAIGVILDGLASGKGTPSRGARYNSAIRYVESSKHACMAIVVSEDGSIDLVPDLRPQIHRSDVLDALVHLEQLTEESQFDLKAFSKTMEWLNAHRFYLLPEMCEQANRLRHKVEMLRDRLVDPSVVRITYTDFSPDAEMNESYFLLEHR